MTPPGDRLPSKKTFWFRILAFVVALALLAWFVDLFITVVLKAAS